MKKYSLYICCILLTSCNGNNNLVSSINSQNNIITDIENINSIETKIETTQYNSYSEISNTLDQNENLFKMRYLKNSTSEYVGNYRYSGDRFDGFQGFAITDNAIVYTRSKRNDDNSRLSEIYYCKNYELNASGNNLIKKNLSEFCDTTIYDHFGDIVYSKKNKLFFIPVEAKNKKLNQSIILILDTNLKLISTYILDRKFEIIDINGVTSEEYSLPWVAINEYTGHLYMSSFNAKKIYIYGFNSSNSEVTFIKTILLKDSNNNDFLAAGIQGGEISPSGHIFLQVQGVYKTVNYLGQNVYHKRSNKGLFIFDSYSGEYINYQFSQFDENKIQTQEFEGVAFGSMSNKYKGNIHSITYEMSVPILNKPARIWLKNYSFNSRINSSEINFEVKHEYQERFNETFINIPYFDSNLFEVSISYLPTIKSNPYYHRVFSKGLHWLEFASYSSTYQFPQIPIDCDYFEVTYLNPHYGLVELYTSEFGGLMKVNNHKKGKYQPIKIENLPIKSEYFRSININIKPKFVLQNIINTYNVYKYN